jgi:hypothetical protein
MNGKLQSFNTQFNPQQKTFYNNDESSKQVCCTLNLPQPTFIPLRDYHMTMDFIPLIKNMVSHILMLYTLCSTFCITFYLPAVSAQYL